MKLALGPLLLAVAVACGTPSGPAPKPPIKPVVHPTTTVDGLPETPIPTTHKPYTVVEAPHSGSITLIALTADGTAALSADDMGGIRLWPALDGSAEPRVVDLPPPRQLGIGRHADGFVIASLDEAGGLYIAKLDATGRKVSHVTLAPDPAYLGFEMSALGLLAWRADQTIDVIDADGATKSRLPTEARQRLVALAVAGKRAITIVETEDAKRVVRWLDLEPKLAWGAVMNVGDDPGQDIALSPKATHYAVARRDERTAVVQLIDVAKKKVIASTPTIASGADLAFIDDDVVAVGTLEGINWIDATLPQPVMSASTRTTGSRLSTAVAAGGGHAVTGQNGELVVATPSGTSFLGYDLISPRFVEPAGNGQLLIGLRDTFSYLDSHLRETSTEARFPAPINLSLTQLVWVDGDHWLGEAVTPGQGTSSGISLIDAGGGFATELRTGLKEASILMYEPSTQMLTQSFGPIAEAAHLDLKTKKLDKISSIAKQGAYEQVVLAPLSPKLARGNQLVQITLRDKPTIKWLKDARALDKVAATLTLDGSYAGTDAAGHVYMWRNSPGDHLELVVYADGKMIAQLPAKGPVSLWPDGEGKRIVEVATNAVSLLETTTGKQLWTQELGAVQQAMWLSDGSLAITSASGIAKLDPATGAVTAARCGWRFGLSPKPHPPAARVEPLCTQLDR